MVNLHTSHRPGDCPVAEKRCAHEEMWALSALDMDGIEGDKEFDHEVTLYHRKVSS